MENESCAKNHGWHQRSFVGLIPKESSVPPAPEEILKFILWGFKELCGEALGAGKLGYLAHVCVEFVMDDLV